jgi:class 3 adenylate cyclase
MFTDLVGYTAHTQRYEALALELLEEHRRLLRELFPKFNGREIETTDIDEKSWTSKTVTATDEVMHGNPIDAPA